MTPDNITAGAVIATLFNLVKPYIDALVPQGSKLHDPTMRLVVIALGGLLGVFTLFMGGAPITLHSTLAAAVEGAKSGLAAVILYHLIPGDLLPSPAPAATPAATAAQHQEAPSAAVI